MDKGQETAAAGVEKGLKMQRIAPAGKGDVVLFQICWGRHWIKDNVIGSLGAPLTL